MFLHSVKLLLETEILSLLTNPDINAKKITSNQLNSGPKEKYVCHNCYHVFVKLKKTPRMSVCNNLQLDPIPPELVITDLELQLVSPNMLFMKIFKLPSSRLNATIGKLINVPLSTADIVKTINTLPRNLDSAYMLPVNLKRKMSMKTPHLSEFIKVKTLIKAIIKLKELNPYYKDIKVNLNYTLSLEGEEEDTGVDQSEKSGDSNEEDDDEQIISNVAEFQTKRPTNVCMVPMEMESMVVENFSDINLSTKRSQAQRISVDIAPGKIHFLSSEKLCQLYLLSEYFRGRKDSNKLYERKRL